MYSLIGAYRKYLCFRWAQITYKVYLSMEIFCMFHSLLDMTPFKTGGSIYKKSDLNDKNIYKT